MTTRALIALLFLLVGLLTACTEEEGHLVENKQLSAALQDLRQNGGSVLLGEMIDGDWDQVYISPEPVSRDFVEKQVGAPVNMPEEFTRRGHILVLLKDNAVQEAMFVTPNLLQEGMYDRSVRLVARGYPALIDLEA